MRSNSVISSSGNKTLEAVAIGLAALIRETYPDWEVQLLCWGNFTIHIYDLETPTRFMAFCTCARDIVRVKLSRRAEGVRPVVVEEHIAGTDPDFYEYHLEYANPGLCEDILALLCPPW